MQDLIAGRIDYFCPLAAAAIPQIESETLKAIAIFSKDRLPILPTLASAHEQAGTSASCPLFGSEADSICSA
jgi:tripartite-type tricarboxylate transporter receptor subunit TctC